MVTNGDDSDACCHQRSRHTTWLTCSRISRPRPMICCTAWRTAPSSIFQKPSRWRRWMPDCVQRARLGAMVRAYVEGPGHPNILDMILDMLAPDESTFAFATRKRRAFQTVWFAAVDEVVAQRSQ